MFWVIQNNIYREQKHSILMQTLRNKGIPHAEVKVVPFFDMLLPSDFDSNEYKGSIDTEKEVKIDASQPIIVLGATSLVRMAEKKGWRPGSFLNENFHYQHWLKAFGSHLLNTESLVVKFRDVQPIWDTFFIRPCEDTKDFAGTVYTKEKFEEWRKKCLEDDGCLFADSEVVASPVKNILAEYRFFVVDGEIVAYSQYKLNGELYKTRDIDTKVIDFTKEMVGVWQPARAFVIDIAETDEGYKVIEINNFNSAGYYDADVVKIVEAVENMKY